MTDFVTREEFDSFKSSLKTKLAILWIIALSCATALGMELQDLV